MTDRLFGKTLDGLKTATDGLGLPPFAAGQIARWLYKRHARSFSEMSDLSLAARSSLEAAHEIGLAAPETEAESRDGTKKYLYEVSFAPGGGPSRVSSYVEAAYIPEKDRATLCMSTQAGCRMNCLFCMTGKQGFQGQLSAGEILNQYESLPERDRVTNLVYMGMGEPLDNLEEVLGSLKVLTSDWGYAMSPKRITVSTVGIIPAMRRFLEESSCHLAVSLHSPFDEERSRLMPAQRAHPIREVLEAIRGCDLPKQRRVSFEYIVFGGLNHSAAHVKELARILQGISCRINLIRFHPIPGTALESAPPEAMREFQERLSAKGLRVTIRKSRGEDILAACGLLSTKALVEAERIMTQPGGKA